MLLIAILMNDLARMKEELFQITTNDLSIHFGSLLETGLEDFLTKNYSDSKKIILVDENTHRHCISHLVANFSSLSQAEIIELPAGEENKCLEICEQIWQTLLAYQVNRNDVIINLGGGVITDMGGFIASLYKRGIDFIHIPTSLLAMVDASIGGKTGVDLHHFKNIVGVFALPKAIYIDTSFLQTLPEIDRLGGWVEMIKHGLIADSNHWNEIKDFDFEKFDMTSEMIYHSVMIKVNIVSNDPYEKGLRKTLNFGHTFGHALESYYLEKGDFINHGIAVAVGILIESYWSWRNQQLPISELNEIQAVLLKKIDLPSLSSIPKEELWRFMKNDKKNHSNKTLSVFINGIGNTTFDNEVSFELLEDSILHFNQLILTQQK